MRAVRVPAAIAVCSEPNHHYVITAVDTCGSFQQYKQEKLQQGTRSNHRFRLDGLLPDDWTRLLALGRSLTHPQKSFNFSSPGDMGRPKSAHGEGSNGGDGVVIENGAYLHVVERTAGDFVPNNMIYHHLQRYTINDSGAEGKGSAATAAGFRELVKQTQAQPAQSPEEAAATVAAADCGSITAEEKARLDPLASVDDAVAKSAVNARIHVAVKGEGEEEEGGAANPTDAPPVFTFYPFPCPVAASIPYRSKHFCVMVNLKPIVPNHLMVVPLRCVGTVHALTAEEMADWGRTVVLTMRVLNEVRRRERVQHLGGAVEEGESGNYSVAIQQGEQAGQTVPHLHTHIIPFDPNGKLAGEPEAEEKEQASRPPRTVDTMKEETDVFKPIFKALEATL